MTGGNTHQENQESAPSPAEQSPQVNSTTISAKCDLLLKTVPVLALFLYVVGYLVRLAYFRSINVHCIDFFKADCFETGAYFLVLSLSLLAFIGLPIAIILLHKLGSRLIPEDLTLLGCIMSVVSVLAVFVTSLVTVLFLRPQDVAKVHVHLAQMITTAVGFVVTLLGATYLHRKSAVAEKAGRAWLVSSRFVNNVGDVIRVGFFIIIARQVFVIFWRDIPNQVRVFGDEYCLAYVFFLTLFAAAAARMAWKMATGDSGPVKAQSRSGMTSPAHNLVRRTYLWLATGIRVALTMILFFLLLVSFAFGPFLHIPTSRGGGRQYSTIQIELSDTNTVSRYPFVPLGSLTTTNLFLLAENNSWVYVASVGPDDPRDAFRALAKGTTYCIDKRQVRSIAFQKLP